MTNVEVLDVIHAAFQDMRYPGDEHLSWKTPQCPSEYLYVADYFKGKHWKDITLDGLRKDYPGPHDACLSFMSPEAFRFYLPSYMVIAVTEDTSDDNTVDSAEYALTPPKADLQTWWEQRIMGLTQAQQQAIIVFLEYLDARWQRDPKFGPHDALAYWKQRVRT